MNLTTRFGLYLGLFLLHICFCSLQSAAIVPVAPVSAVTTLEQPKQPESLYTLQTALTEPIAKEVVRATGLPRDLSKIIGSYIPSLPIELLPLCLGQHKPPQRSNDRLYSGLFSVSEGFYVARFDRVYERTGLGFNASVVLNVICKDLYGGDAVVASVALEQEENRTGIAAQAGKSHCDFFCCFGRQANNNALTLYVAFTFFESNRELWARLIAFDFDISEQSPSNRLKNRRTLLQFLCPHEDSFFVKPHLVVSDDKRSLSLRILDDRDRTVSASSSYLLPHGTVIPYPDPMGNLDDHENLVPKLKKHFQQSASASSWIRLDSLQVAAESGLALVRFSIGKKTLLDVDSVSRPHVVLFDKTSGKTILMGKYLRPFESNPSNAKLSFCGDKIMIHPSGLLYLSVNLCIEVQSCGIASDVVKAIIQRPEQVEILKGILQRYHATYDQGWAPTPQEIEDIRKLDPIVKQSLDAYVSRDLDKSDKVSYRKVCDAVRNLVRAEGGGTEAGSRQLIVPLVHDTDIEPKQPFIEEVLDQETEDRYRRIIKMVVGAKQAARHRRARYKKFAAVAISCVAAAGGYKLFKKWKSKRKLPITVSVR